MTPEPKKPLLHVYGVVDATAARLLSTLKGRRGAPLRGVRQGPIAWVVSELEPGARLNREDLLSHARVLEHLAGQRSVLPMRFGVQAQGERALRRHLPDAQRVRALLRQFDGLCQLSVEAAHHQEAALSELLRRDAQLVALREHLQQTPHHPGLKIQLGERVAAAFQALQVEDAHHLLQALTPLAREVAVRPGSTRVVSASFLVERKARSRFDAAVARIRRGLPRLELRYLGPQPPWAFLHPASLWEKSWAS